MSPTPHESTAPLARLVALGASNLTRGAGSLIECAQEQTGGPVDVLAALGLGRSFGVRSSILGRSLPGIDDCGLWDALASAAPLPATGLLMDVGNDLLYGVETPAILGWVERALARLRPRVDRLVVAALPMPNLRRLGKARYTVLRSLLFPRCRTPLPEMLQMAEQLDNGLADLAARQGGELVRLSSEWYGFDPIHVRRRCWTDASRALLGVGPAPATARRPRWRRQLRLALARPALRWRFGREQRAPQPSLCWPNGTTVSLW